MLIGYIVKWAVLSAILSFLAMFCWNILSRNVFHSVELNYIEVLSIWILLSLVPVAINGLKYLVVHPR